MSTPLLTRAQIGLRPPRSITRLASPEGLTAHYWGPSPWGKADRSTAVRFAATADHNRCASIWRAAQDFHMAPGWGGTRNGGADVAYSSGVCPHGVRLEGRGPGVRTGAQGTNTGNSRSLATCYIAGDNDPLTPAAQLAFLDEARRLGGWAKPRWDHGDWKATACAGPSIRPWKAAGWPRPGGTAKPPTALPLLPPTSGGLTMSDIKAILDAVADVKQEVRALPGKLPTKPVAVSVPGSKTVWVVGVDGYRKELPAPAQPIVDVLAYLGYIKADNKTKHISPITAENLKRIPVA